MPMVWYIPPLSPVVDVVRDTGEDAEDKGNLFAAIDALRIPVEYLANLFTAGDVVPVDGVLRKLAAMRSYMRDINLGRDPDESIPAAVGMTEEEMYDMFRLLAIAKYDERYVIPPAHAEQAHALEELATECAGQRVRRRPAGPVRRGLGRPDPGRGRELPDAAGPADLRRTTGRRRLQAQGRVNLLNWDGKGTPEGLFPPKDGDGADVARSDAASDARAGRRAGRGRPALALLDYPDARSSSTALDDVEPPASTDAASCSSSWPTCDAGRPRCRRSRRSYVETFDHTRTLRALPHLLRLRRHPPPGRGAGALQAGLPSSGRGAGTSRGELPDHLLRRAAVRGHRRRRRRLAAAHRPPRRAGDAAPRARRLASRGRLTGSPWHAAVAAVCATLPPLAGDETDAVRRLVEQGPPAEEVGLEPYGGADPRLDPPDPSSPPRSR